MAKRLQSFDELKSANDMLQGDKQGSTSAIRDFLSSAVKAGAFIKEPQERRSAQDMLDYWFTQLLVSSDEDMTSVSPRLQQYDMGSGKQRGSGADGLAESMSNLERSRQIIRLGALARQWKLNGKATGYLLKGEALDTARQYRTDDPDIEALVKASEREERTAKRLRTRLVVLGFTLLASLTAMALWQAHTATQAAKLAQEEKGEAEAQRSVANEAAKASEEARLRAEKLAIQFKTDSEALRRQMAELQNQQSALDAAAETIRRQNDILETNRLPRAELPDVIANLIKPGEAVDIFTDPAVTLTGYDRGFLGVDIPLPSLSETNRLTALQGGRPFDYINYSVVMNQRRRMAFYTAVNMDRTSLRVLPRIPPRSRFPVRNDPRIPPGVQVPLDWFVRPEVDIGHLTTRAEISWGPAFDKNTSTSARVLDDAVNVATNIAPQFDNFNRGIWAALERWVVTQHNPQARQVTIFTGPVFSKDDLNISGAFVPRAFWKIAVSALPNFSKDASTRYVVDAFLISQFKPGTNERIARREEIRVNEHRVPVAELERLTGLTFAEIIQSTDKQRNPLLPQTLGDILAAKAKRLGGPDAAEREAIVQELVTGLRDDALPWAEQQKVIKALLQMAQAPSMEKLGAAGRLNLLFVLSQVPPSTWNLEDAIDLKAGARHAAEQQDRGPAGSSEIDPQTREHFVQWEQNIGFAQKSAQTVYLQFAGLTRSGASEISAQMQRLGWAIPGEERIEGIAADEVRYNPADEADALAARLLAADLRAAGRTTMQAKPNIQVAGGTLEIWLRE